MSVVNRERIGGFPIDVRQEGEELVIRLFPGSLDAKYPDQSVQTIRLDVEDRLRLIHLLSG
jgi:hypothetical protein